MIADFTAHSATSMDHLPLSLTPTEGVARYAGEGLQPDHGKRRSVRTHHRPLEWWRSEKKVYTRYYRSAHPVPCVMQAPFATDVLPVCLPI